MIDRRLIVLTNDLPYPPNHGHKVDQYQRWRGFAEQGWRLQLVCWRSPQDSPTDAVDLDALSAIFENIEVLPIGHDWVSLARRLALTWRYPSHVASRIPNKTTCCRLIANAQAFAPAAVILDGIYGGVLGKSIDSAIGVPTILRGHNVEHLYFAQQAAAARHPRDRLAWTVARLGLEHYERALVRDAAWTFDVSADDVAFWRGEGIDTISWLPTAFPHADHGTLLAPTDKAFDVAYIGNLRLPNNLRGLAWFIDTVLPKLRRLRPGTTFCFAGANPSEEARALFARAPEIMLVPNAPSADAILSQGRVLVNPILSGSGINVKSIDMLRYDAPIITTPVGVQGFSAELAEQFVVREDAVDFAAAILGALTDPVPPAGRATARTRFGQAGLAEQMTLIERIAAGG